MFADWPPNVVQCVLINVILARLKFMQQTEIARKSQFRCGRLFVLLIFLCWFDLLQL